MIVYILIIGGASFLFLGLIFKYTDLQSKKWIETNGTIIESKLNESYSIDTEHGSGKTKIYQTTIKYEYKPKETNKHLIGTKLFPIRSNGWTTKYQEQLSIYEKLNAGTQVKVYYNPNITSNCCLIQGKNHILNIIFYISFFMIGIGIGIYIQELSYETQLILNKIEISK